MDAEQMKRCSVCQRLLDRARFSNHAGQRDGLQSRCKACDGAYYATHRAAYRARLLKFEIAHPGYHKKYRSWPKARYGSYRAGAARRGHVFGLTLDEFMRFWAQPCTYCQATITTIGLDRVDNARGYELGNVVPCCKDCNLAKGTRTRDDFLAHVAAIYAVSLGAVFTDQVPATKKAVA